MGGGFNTPNTVSSPAPLLPLELLPGSSCSSSGGCSSHTSTRSTWNTWPLARQGLHTKHMAQHGRAEQYQLCWIKAAQITVGSYGTDKQCNVLVTSTLYHTVRTTRCGSAHNKAATWCFILVSKSLFFSWGLLAGTSVGVHHLLHNTVSFFSCDSSTNTPYRSPLKAPS